MQCVDRCNAGTRGGIRAAKERNALARQEIEAKDLVALNALMQKNNIPAIAPAAEKAEEGNE